MDLNSIEAFAQPKSPADLDRFQTGDAWLAGGTWLFSETQPNLRRLISLDGFGWPSLTTENKGLTISATCRIAELDAFEAPGKWQAAPLIGACCRAFLSSFKIWNKATVGGNLCMSLPAGPMISLCTGLGGVCEIWARDGGVRRISALDFVQGPLLNDLAPGELLRAIHLPQQALERRAAMRRASLSPMGRSGVLLIGTVDTNGAISLTVTASTKRPVRIEFACPPDPNDLASRLGAAIPTTLYHEDVHGKPDWRRHMTHEFAREIIDELKEHAA